MLTRLFSILLLLIGITAVAAAQESEPSEGADTTYQDTVRGSDEYPDYGNPESTEDTSYTTYTEPEPMTSPAPFAPGAGFYAGPTFEVTSLDPAKLDPVLDGDLVLYGGQFYAIISGWVIGGHWTSATLYDLSPAYDEFSFSYGGFLTGYDMNIVSGLSARLGFLVGGGDLNMVKKRPDLRALDTTRHEILERYRKEGFFLVRPGLSVGYSPLPFLDLRFSVDYLYPIGGSTISDLKTLTYGLHIMLGVGK